MPKGLDAARGVYYGELFTGNRDKYSQQYGPFTATINPKNGFSAKIVLGGKTYSVTGKLDADGKVTTSIKKTRFTLEFTLDLNGGNRIDGPSAVTAGLPTSMPCGSAKQRVPATADLAGTYTLADPG